MPLLIEYESLFVSDHHLKEALKLIYMDILKFHLQALRFFRGNRKGPSPASELIES